MHIQDNIFPVTKEEILEQYSHIFNNEFQKRSIEQDFVWNIWTDKKHYGFFSTGYTKGHSTSAILITKEGEKDYVEFWKYYGNHKVNFKIQYGYSFKKRESFKEILN